MTPWQLCALAFLVLATAGGCSADDGSGRCPGPCVSLESCEELAKLSRPGYNASTSEARLLKSAKCKAENMVCCPPKNSSEVSPKVADGSSANGEDDKETEVGVRRLGFGFGSNDDNRQFGFNSWPFAPVSFPGSSSFGPTWGSGAQRPTNSFGSSFGSPWGSNTQRPSGSISSPWGSGAQRPAPISSQWNLDSTTTRRPSFDREPIRNPYDVPHRPSVHDVTSTSTRRPQGNRRPTTHRPSVNRNDDLFPNGVCGITSDDRIFGGNMSTLFELPWMARLGYSGKLSRRVSYRCGGALINSRYVLTAAHCVGDGNDPDQVRLGELDEQSEIDCQDISGDRVCGPKVVDVDIERIIRHPGFSSEAGSDNYLKNDIALLRLRSPVPFTEAVKPICLPNGDTPDISGKKAVVAGWGRDKENSSKGTRFLMKAKVPMVEISECARKYQSRELFLDRQSQICAGGEGGIDSCQGDSGGPLFRAGIVKGEPRTVQYGIVSFGLQRCGVEGVPGVYTRVEHFMPWIRQNMRP